MRPEVHLRPDRLLVHAGVADGLSEALQEVLRGHGRFVADEELDRLHTAVRRAVRELGELGAALTTAAVSADRADTDASLAIRRALS